MKTKSAGEALSLLESVRAPFIKLGREIAVELARTQGTVHARQVRAVMKDRDLLPPPPIKDYWLGCVFKGSKKNPSPFEKTGEIFYYTDSETNSHSNRIDVWRLRGEQ